MSKADKPDLRDLLCSVFYDQTYVELDLMQTINIDSAVKKLTQHANALLDELVAEMKLPYTLEQVGDMNKHLDSLSQQSAYDKSEGQISENERILKLIKGKQK